MPAYAALSDLLARFPEHELVQATDDVGVGAVNAATVAEAIERASSTIDAYLAATYQLPLASVPGIVVDLACDIARFRLWTRRGSPTESVERNHSAAIRTLEQIAKGTLKIDAGAREQPARDGAVIVEGDDGRVFGRESLKGF